MLGHHIRSGPPEFPVAPLVGIQNVHLQRIPEPAIRPTDRYADRRPCRTFLHPEMAHRAVPHGLLEPLELRNDIPKRPAKAPGVQVRQVVHHRKICSLDLAKPDSAVLQGPGGHGFHFRSRLP